MVNILKRIKQLTNILLKNFVILLISILFLFNLLSGDRNRVHS